MDYYDGNTVTALWNYAQHFAMSDNSYGTTFGGTALGHLNIVSGDTGGVDMSNVRQADDLHAERTERRADARRPGRLLADQQRQSVLGRLLDQGVGGDDRYEHRRRAERRRDLVGLLQGRVPSHDDVRPGDRGNPADERLHSPRVRERRRSTSRSRTPPTSGLCNSDHAIGAALGGTGQYGYNNDYSHNQEPFQFYASTANPHHLTVPTDAGGNDTLAGLEEIGHDTQSYVNGQPQFNTPNHQYDMSDFDQLVAAIATGELPPSALPAVSFLKASTYETGHAADSDPADEQQFVTREINALERTPDWSHTAVILTWDDSDGWYDHAFSGVTNPSLSLADNLTNTMISGASVGPVRTRTRKPSRHSATSRGAAASGHGCRCS